MTLPWVTDDVMIDLSMIFAYDFDRALLVKYNAAFRVPLRAIVREIFAKKKFHDQNVGVFGFVFIITQKVFKILTCNLVCDSNGTISRGRLPQFFFFDIMKTKKKRKCLQRG